MHQTSLGAHTREKGKVFMALELKREREREREKSTLKGLSKAE